MRIVYSILFPFILSFSCAFSQQHWTPEKAQESFNAKDWKTSIAAYSSLTLSNPENGLYWYRLGYCYQVTNQFERAINSYKQVYRINPKNNTALYNLACASARAQRPQEALEWLEKAVQAGFIQIKLLQEDDDLSTVRGSKKFSEILTQAQKASSPCEYDPLARQFDYWIGEWNVTNTQGQKVGESSIQKILNGCVIFENWFGTTGYTGKSFNFVDPLTKKWRQLWIDARGGKIEFTGSLEGKNLVFFSHEIDSSGNATDRRLTFFNLGDSVRQFSEMTPDSGRSWVTEYDFMYTRKQKE